MAKKQLSFFQKVKRKLIFHFIDRFPYTAIHSSLKHDAVYRSRALKRAIQKFSRALKKAEFQQSLLITQDTSFTYSDGILLSNKGTDRYLKTSGTHGNRGAEMLSFLKSNGVDPNIVIDIGANFGEISLYFCRHSQAAKVLAVEPSSENLRIFYDNIKTAAFDTSALQVIPAAVSDKDGEVKIFEGNYSMNSIIRKGNSGRSSMVRALSLNTLFKEYLSGEKIDFIKIDVEQAEFLLFADILLHAQRIKAMLIEFSDPKLAADYKTFSQGLIEKGFSCYLNDNSQTQIYIDKLDQVFNHSLTTLDIWFVQKNGIDSLRH